MKEETLLPNLMSVFVLYLFVVDGVGFLWAAGVCVCVWGSLF